MLGLFNAARVFLVLRLGYEVWTSEHDSPRTWGLELSSLESALWTLIGHGVSNVESMVLDIRHCSSDLVSQVVHCLPVLPHIENLEPG